MFRSRVQKAITIAIAVLAGVALYAIQQSNEQPALHSDETVRTATRLVLVDVVATDNQGKPVTGLEARDFTITESGASQKIANFSYHHVGDATAAPPQKLAPGVITNAPQIKASSMDVLLFDGINGDFQAHAYAKDQTLKFLATGNLDRPLAIYVLENQLKLLHDFSVDAPALRSSLEKYNFPGSMITTQSWENKVSAFSVHDNYHVDGRSIESTLNQLNALAKILGGYPGRKNLIWVSEGFPLNFYPDSLLGSSAQISRAGNSKSGSAASEQAAAALSGQGAAMTAVAGGALRDYAQLVKKVSDALMAAQIAVYPVDASGLGKDSRTSSLHTMNDLASRTGGKVYANRNDIAESLRASVDDGSTYYTLEYYPDNKNWDGQFRSIKVKVDRPGVSLRYREGYYALDPEKTRKDEAQKLAEDYSRILRYDAPTVTGVQFQAAVLPPSRQTGNKVLVNFAVDPHTINFAHRDDGLEHAVVHCTVWAYGKDKNKPIMSKNDSTPADVKPDVYQQIMKSYFPCKQQLDLSSGTYTLKLGVLDRNSNRMGTLTTSVTVP